MQQASVLIVEDDKTLREALTDSLELAGYACQAVNDGESALALLDKSKPGLIISDINMGDLDGHALLKAVKKRTPKVPVLLITAYGNVASAVTAMQDGAVDYLTKPFEPKLLTDKVKKHIHLDCVPDKNPVAEDPNSKELLSLASKIADSNATVLITGESGTGKEVLAHYIHDYSNRREHPFVAINCAAIPENMLEATLFGYEKGAFTGAYQASPGKFEQAQNGTLLLDEISEMDLSLQAKLLRVLQEKEVERIGGKKTIQLDVRVIATSNRDLVEEARKGNFREDLYYRLNVFPLRWRPLRERTKDIIPLAEYLLNIHAQAEQRAKPSFSNAAQKALLAHAWPGNAREMDNVIQRALILQSGDVIKKEDLQFEFVQGK